MLLGKKKPTTEKEIYNQYANYLFTVCYRFVGHREIAEELLNDGFLKAFNHFHDFREHNENSLKHWLKKIMINECLMYLRKKIKFEIIQIEPLHENRLPLVSEYSCEDDIINIIQKLPIGYRTVFNLFAIEGYSHSEISNELGIAESTSRSQLTMARKLLKEHLRKTGYETA